MIPNVERILAYLSKVQEATPTEISKKARVNYQVLKYLLKELENKKLIKKRTNDTKSFEYWKLTNKENANETNC